MQTPEGSEISEISEKNSNIRSENLNIAAQPTGLGAMDDPSSTAK